MLKLELKRTAKKDTYTIGKLYLNGEYFCDTLEDKDRDLNKDGDLNDAGEGKVYGETAIPYGTYTVVLTMSARFKKVLPLIENVKHFSGIRIHPGNSAADSHGCVLVGKNSEVGKVTNSKATFEKLMVRLVDASEMKETITITIS
jgi:hypothetical protein